MSDQSEYETPSTEEGSTSEAETIITSPAVNEEAAPSPVEPIELEKLPPTEEPVPQPEMQPEIQPEPQPDLPPEVVVSTVPTPSEPPAETIAPPPPPPPPPPPVAPAPLTPSEEHTWAMLANLSVLLNLVTGFLGPIVALVIYLVFRDRSPYVRFQAMQAFVFQLVWWVLAGLAAALLWVLAGISLIICVGFCLVPLAIFVTLIPLAALVYGVVGGIETSKGADFRYWIIGNWVKEDITR